MIEKDHPEISISTQAELLGLNRTSLYYKSKSRNESENVDKQMIIEVFEKYPFFGYRKLNVFIRTQKGRVINHKRVLKYMNELGIQAIYPGPNMSKRNFMETAKPYLLRNVKAEHPDHIWSIDITYIKMQQGFMYLVAIIDWYSRYVVAWELSNTLEISFVLEVVKKALKTGIPEYWNSDQGSHFTSSQYINILEELKINVSMDGKGRALDNIFIERFWRSVKYEEIYLNEYETPRQLRQSIVKYINFYNLERPHQSLKYKTPKAIYTGECIVKERNKTKSRKSPSNSWMATTATRYASRQLFEERRPATREN